MKMKIMKLGIIFLGSLLFQISFAHSQSFMVSNLDHPTTNPFLTGNAFWGATSFETGSEETTLQSMVTRLQNFDGGNEFVSIYNDHETEDWPGSEAISFLENPVDLMTNDRFRFTPDGTNILLPNTTYWLVFGVTGSGTFNFFYVESGVETGSTGWSIGSDLFLSSSRGNVWQNLVPDNAIQFQINAIIPESSTYAFASGICLVGFATFRRIRISQTS